MKEKEKNHPDCKVATQRNDLIHGQQTLSLIQKRIFALTVKQIQRGDEDYKTYSIDVGSLVNTGTSRSVFNRLEKETKKLMAKVLTKRSNKRDKKSFTHWSMVSKAYHMEGEGRLEIDLHPDIRDMLLNLKEQGNFTPVPVAELLACRSTYGQRMYELLYSWRRTGRWEITVKDLRFSLGAEDKYSNFSDFRRSILEKAQKDVKIHTNMQFNWTEECRARGRGKGKKVTHLTFKFSFKADQMDLALEVLKKETQFDIYDLRNRLKNHAKLPPDKVEKVMQYLENNPDRQDQFKNDFGPVSNNLQVGQDSDGRAIKSPAGYAWSKIQPLIASK